MVRLNIIIINKEYKNIIENRHVWRCLLAVWRCFLMDENEYFIVETINQTKMLGGMTEIEREGVILSWLRIEDDKLLNEQKNDQFVIIFERNILQIVTVVCLCLESLLNFFRIGIGEQLVLHDLLLILVDKLFIIFRIEGKIRENLVDDIDLVEIRAQLIHHLSIFQANLSSWLLQSQYAFTSNETEQLLDYFAILESKFVQLMSKFSLQFLFRMVLLKDVHSLLVPPHHLWITLVQTRTHLITTPILHAS